MMNPDKTSRTPRRLSAADLPLKQGGVRVATHVKAGAAQKAAQDEDNRR